MLPERFGSLDLAIFTLFAMLTLDNWSDNYESAREVAPSMIIFLCFYIIVETFIFINLFMAVIVNNLEEAQDRNARQIAAENKVGCLLWPARSA